MIKRHLLIALFLYASFGLFSQEQEQKVSLLFVGDAMQHKAQLDAAKTKEGFDYSSYFSLIKDKIEAADIAVVNLEVTLAGKPYTGYPCFSAPDAFAQELKNAGFDVFLTANNHCLDKGKKGLERTITQLDSLFVRYLGTYIDQEKRDLRYPLMLKKNGIRIAMLNYTYGTNGIEVKAPNKVNYIDKKQIAKDIAAAKSMFADVIIANMHWGDEYKLMPNKEQKDLANFLIKNGVNIVIGGHPHVVQPIDIRKEGDEIKQVIVYSMGNFVSGMSAINTDGGMMVSLEISKNGDAPVKIDKCDYSLVWVDKPSKFNDNRLRMIPVNEYKTESEGKAFLGETGYSKMMRFAGKAKETTEAMWEKKSIEEVKH